ncbi:MAG: GNAT family N-acetyltransferase [Dehalococcoidia bacterium]
MAEKTPYTVDVFDEARDEAGVLELLSGSMGDASLWETGGLWRWKHVLNPFGRSLVLVARDPGGRVIGLRAFMRWGFVAGGEEIGGYRPVDTATDPSFRRRGIFSELTLRALSDARDAGGDLVFNTPNRMSVGGYLKMGWTYVTDARASVRISGYPRFAVRAAAQRLGLGPKAAPAWEGDGSVGELLSRGDALERLISADLGWQRDLIVTRRSVEYARWRYMDHPVHRYGAVSIGDLDGCCFVRPVSRGGLRGLILGEFMLSRPERDLVRGLVREAERTYRPDFVMAYAPAGSFLGGRLKGLGFRWRSGSGTNWVVNPLRGGIGPDPASASSWPLGMSDLEFF